MLECVSVGTKENVYFADGRQPSGGVHRGLVLGDVGLSLNLWSQLCVFVFVPERLAVVDGGLFKLVDRRVRQAQVGVRHKLARDVGDLGAWHQSTVG